MLGNTEHSVADESEPWQIYMLIMLIRKECVLCLLNVRRALIVCMNFVEGGICHATRQMCMLGPVYRTDQLCHLQGCFDVWVTQDDNVLLSDIGAPSPEPKRSLALGVEKSLAVRIAQAAAGEMDCRMLTSQQTCHQCGRSYWISEHESEGTPRLGRRHFCPSCLRIVDQEASMTRAGLNYWCG